ncbi:MAG: PKD domain-containing protein [Thermoplasmatales archaeon]|nr:PKD domain-containing protein [Thermoplasmatales archaeon]
MKIEKVLILAMTICCLLIVSSINVAAAEETKTITDSEDDVVDVYSGKIYDYPNIDITELKYEREGTNATITMTVKGEIENLGDFEDPTGLENSVTYTLTLTTSFDTYFIYYVNNYCALQTSYDDLNITDFSIVGSTLNALEINFNINNTDETYVSLAGESMYLSIDLATEDYIMATDAVPDYPLMVDAYAPNSAEAGSAVEFEVSPYFGQRPYEFHWDFGDESTSTEQNPTHIYDEPGIYEYTFTVTDSLDTPESVTYEIEILEGDTNDTPGFEFIIAIMAIGFIFLWKRKR